MNGSDLLQNSQTHQTDDFLLTVPDVAKQLHISSSMVYALVQRGTLTAVRIGTAVRIRPRDMKDFIQQSLTTTQG